MEHNVKKVIMIEGKLGQGTASGQTEGFIKSYAEAGKDVGNLADNVGVKGAGGKDLQVVFWGSGGWFADPAKKVMQDAITSLGPDGSMAPMSRTTRWWPAPCRPWKKPVSIRPSTGSAPATARKSRGSGSGRNDHDGRERDRDAGGGHRLSADKAYFAGQPYKKAVFVSVIPFNKSNINVDKLVPFFHDDYMNKRDAGAFVYDINDPSFRENPGY